MNTLRFATRRAAPSTGRRFASIGPAPPMPKPPVPEMYHYNLNKAWFSDPSTYPLLFSLTFAGTFIVGMTINAFVYYKDIKINPAHKHQVIRDWGEGKTKTFTEACASSHYHTNPEGLGVDHKEWMKSKQQS